MPKPRTFPKGILLACLCLALFCSAAQAQEHTLVRIDRSRDEGKTLFQLSLSAVPEFEVKTSGQRVDVLLFDTGMSESLDKLEAGGELARTLLAEQGGRTIVSLVLRRPPDDVEYSTAKDNTVLRLRVSWPEEGERSRPAMAMEMDGQLSIGQKGVSLRREVSSPYRDNWEAFFREYELPLRVEPEMAPTLPSFSGLLYPGDREELPALVLEYAEEKEWNRALEALNPSTGEGPEVEDARRRVLRAELLLRQGRIRRARDLLRQPRQENGYGSVLSYLRAFAAAADGDPYLGYARARDLAFPGDAPKEWTTYGRLLEIETALGSGHAERAYALAPKLPEEGFPHQRTFALRKAQAAFAMGRREQAFAELQGFSRDMLREHPSALAQLARARYENGDYGRSLQLYSRLAHTLSDPDRIAMARFGEAMSDLHRGAEMLAKSALMRIAEESDNSRAKWRAKLELADLAVQSGEEATPAELAASYREIARGAKRRDIREEAAFKRILVARLSGHNRMAVEWLGPYLRDYAAGDLLPHARALLVEILPGVVRDLLDQEAYIRAMALVQEHSDDLRYARLPLDFLYDLGAAFDRLGFFDRSSQVYEYMMSLAESPDKREDIYPLLIRSYFHQREYGQSGDYARDYVEEYPGGEREKTVYLLLAKSLEREGKEDRVAELLRSPDRPVSRGLDALAGELFFDMDLYGEAHRYLARATGPKWRQAPRDLLLLKAESLFREGTLGQALPVYAFLQEEGYQREQARYRIGQIRARTGREGEGAKAWRRIVDTNESPLWTELAREGLAIRELEKRMRE